jgi:hypothetical protein
MAHHLTQVWLAGSENLVEELAHILIGRSTELIELGKNDVIQDLILYRLAGVLEP